jgi:uncharacterized protein (TIGR00369 family)
VAIEQTDKAAEGTRTVSWPDPRISANAFRTLSGLDLLCKIASGEIPQPPICHLLGFRLVEAEPGFAVFELETGEHQLNPAGTVHGGVACTLLDSAMSCAVQTKIPAGSAYTTLELKVNLVRTILATTGLLRCEGRAIHVGSRIGTGEGKLIDREGKLYAHGTTTCMIMAQG